MSIKATVKYFCDDETCFASLRVPINEDVSEYGWSHAKIIDYYWILCPRHNPKVVDSKLGKRILEEGHKL